jgi:predicted DNA-binding transcriptional regulator YafY
MSTTNSIAQTVTEGSRVRMIYKSVESGITERVVDVERVWTCKAGCTAFVGFCHTRGEHRTFNLANVLFAMADDDTTLVTFAADRPPGLPVPTTDLRMLLSVTGMDAWHADRAMQTAATA